MNFKRVWLRFTKPGRRPKDGSGCASRALVLSFVVSLFILVGMLILAMNGYRDNRQEMKLQAYEKYSLFSLAFNDFINSHTNLLKGLSAYIQTEDNLTESSRMEEYLDNLLRANLQYIRNVGIIKDTTIIWNYPYENNKGAVGTDLVKVENQREALLEVKNTLKPKMMGPVDLVQGGQGYIIRLPLLDEQGAYWGQTSIVLKADVFNAYVEDLCHRLNMDCVIYSNQVPVVGSEAILDENTYAFEMTGELFTWDVRMNLHADGQWLQHDLYMYLVLGVLLSLAGFVLTFLLSRAVAQIRYNSAHDKLTGLLNRTNLDMYADKALATCKRTGNQMGVLLFDIDRFKQVNDQYGHHTGDLLLKAFADIFKKNSRRSELLFRMGGDEFMLMLPHMDNAAAMETARERLSEAFGQLRIPATDKRVHVSVGHAVYPDDGDTYDALFLMADSRMYADKNAKRQQSGTSP